MEGVSIGGGRSWLLTALILQLVELPSIVFHKDTFGTIGKVANILGDSSINVGSMQVSRKKKAINVNDLRVRRCKQRYYRKLKTSMV